MGKKWIFGVLVLIVLSGGFSLVSATPTPPIKIISGIVSNVVSALFKCLWSLKSTTKLAIESRSKMKFEEGYTVDTVFDGSKLGIEPYSVEVSPSGELLVLDSANSNLYKISTPLSIYSRPKLVAGSTKGYSGHVDGRPREARMNHPKGLTVDGNGNIYVADTMNMVIRKINNDGVTTIAGGKWGRGGGHVDGPSEEAKFSNDFDIVYIGKTCSLLVIDRGNMAIREIQLHDDDCSQQYDTTFHLGIAMLVVAAFFGYMLALLQYRIRAMFSSTPELQDPRYYSRIEAPSSMQYQRSHNKSLRPALTTHENETEKLNEGFFCSMGRLLTYTCSTVVEILIGVRKKPLLLHQFEDQYNNHPNQHTNTWPIQDSYVIPDEDDPPPLESTRAHVPKRTYQFMAKDMERARNPKQSRASSNVWEGNFYQQQMQQKHHHYEKHYSSTPKTCYEKCLDSNQIEFGEVQKEEPSKPVVIKAVDYSDPIYDHHNIRSRIKYPRY